MKPGVYYSVLSCLSTQLQYTVSILLQNKVQPNVRFEVWHPSYLVFSNVSESIDEQWFCGLLRLYDITI